MSKNATLITQKQHAAIAALLTSPDVSKAAAAAGCSRATIYRWLGEEAFKRALQAAEAEAYKGLSRRLAGLADKAADVIRDAMKSDQPIGIRLRAADLATSRGPALHDLVNVQDRLDRLEAMLTERNT